MPVRLSRISVNGPTLHRTVVFAKYRLSVTGMTHPSQPRAPILPPQDSTRIAFVQMAYNRLPGHVQEGILTIRPRLSRPGKATGTTMSASRRQVAEQKHPGGASQLLVPVL